MSNGLPSNYQEYLFYTTAEQPATIARHAELRTSRIIDGVTHTVVLCRSKTALTTPPGYELLAICVQGESCPFSMLQGEALAKYKLAYNTEPYTIPAESEDEEDTVITPPFIFGAFA